MQSVTRPIERKWRVGPPTRGLPGSMYDFVRRYLVAHGGRACRQELLAALQADVFMRERLAHSKGFTALINNMRHSGDIVLAEDAVTATSRTIRRVGISRLGPAIGPVEGA